MTNDGLKVPLHGEVLRVGPFMLLPEILAKFGVAIEPLLAEVGLPSNALSSANKILPVVESVHLLALCAERAKCPHIGLLMGELSTTSLLGLPGMLMRSCRTLGSALQSLVMTLHFNGRGVVPFLLIERQTAMCGITLALSAESGRSQGLDLSAGLACQFIREIMGPDWSATEVRLAHRAPADRSPYERFFKCNVVFDSETSVLVFPATRLAERTKTSDKHLHTQIESVLMTEPRNDAELVLFSSRAIVALIVQRKLSVAAVSEALKMHTRTLNRRLAARQTSVASLVKDVRFALARQLMVDTDLPLTDIAAALNYSDASTFSRNFRRWAGAAPSAWRAEALSGRAAPTA